MKNSEVQEIAFALYDCLRELKSVYRSEFQTEKEGKPEIEIKAYKRGMEVLTKYKDTVQCDYLLKILNED